MEPFGRWKERISPLRKKAWRKRQDCCLGDSLKTKMRQSPDYLFFAGDPRTVEMAIGEHFYVFVVVSVGWEIAPQTSLPKENPCKRQRDHVFK